MRHDVMKEPLFPGSSTTYEETVRAFFEAYVFPSGLSYQGQKIISRDNVIPERVERDGNSWWVTCRARYSGNVLGIGVAERARVEYDNGHISVDIGKLKGVLNTAGIANWLEQDLGKHPDPGGISLGHVYVFQSTETGYFVDYEGSAHKGHALAWPEETGGSRWRVIGQDKNQVMLQNVETGWYLDYVGPHTEEQLSTVIAVPQVTGGSTWQLIEEGSWVRIRNTQSHRYLDFVGPHKEESRRKLIAVPDQTGGGRWKYFPR